MVRSRELLAKVELENLNLILNERRLHRFGYLKDSSGAVRTACDIQIDGRQGTGRPKLTDRERLPWRSGVRSTVHAASQISGRCPLMWMMPLRLHINKKSDYDITGLYGLGKKIF